MTHNRTFWTYWSYSGSEPAHVKRTFAITKASNPDVVRLRRDDIKEYVPDYPWDLVDLWKGSPDRYTTEAVLLKPMLLQRYGGIWLDIDSVAFKPLAPMFKLLDDSHVALMAWPSRGIRDSIVMAKRGAPQLEKVIEDIRRRIKLYRSIAAWRVDPELGPWPRVLRDRRGRWVQIPHEWGGPTHQRDRKGLESRMPLPDELPLFTLLSNRVGWLPDLLKDPDTYVSRLLRRAEEEYGLTG